MFDSTQIKKLTPNLAGKERYEYSEDKTSVKVFAGSGYDKCNPDHYTGNDGLRYGIAIQQRIDAGDYDAADEIASMVRKFKNNVGTGKDFVLISVPQVKGRPTWLV